ncbi:MAG: alanine--tRNA ligase, partial [Dokdonella sp.]
WSFGDYFKRDAILWAWELLTDVWKLPKDRLLVTVYHTDEEAYGIWNAEIGMPPERIVRIGDNKGAPFASDNFWQMADTGPCGPCTEIFYDHGAHIAGGPPGSPDEDGDRYIEIWNLVFMQFDRAADGSLSPLPAPCVDTGMGMERLAAVLQHVHTNYEIDLFQTLIRTASQLTATSDLENKSLRVIADHIRACSFLIVDGVLPSNEGRGYVLRRIIRRALRHGWMLGVRGDFFSKMVAPLVAEMGDAYPELRSKQEFVERALKVEEERFGETLEQGMKLFEEVASRSHDVIPGSDAFRLYDTFGFPVDLTADIARERDMSVDMDGFARAMNQQRDRARAASHFESKGQLPAELASSLPPTVFTGYDSTSAVNLHVLAMVQGGRRLAALENGQDAIVILDRTPFYAESGGQVGDFGVLETAIGRLIVSDTIKIGGAFHGHVARWEGAAPLGVGDEMSATVDTARRQSVVLNHSATHLLHAALRKVLGDHVTQKGSLVAPDRLRFDFSHFQPIEASELRVIEDLVNAEIRRNSEADIRHMTYDEAIEAGAMALFGEKYGDEVRVLRMGDFSTELCGGTHVARTGDIGLFKILGESGVASGIRRIEAVTGAAAAAHVVAEETRLEAIGELLSARGNDVVNKLRQLLDRQKKLERELDGMKLRAASAATIDLVNHAVDVGGIKVVAARIDGLDVKALRESVDMLKQKLGNAVVLLASGIDGKIALVGGVSGTALERIKAGDVVAYVAKEIDGKGGGRADMAQGGGSDTPALARTLSDLAHWIESKCA